MIKRATTLATLLLATLGAAAAPEPALEPLAFLAGHCWKGTMPDGRVTDEHCFTWIFEGKHLRDKHVVRIGDKALYEGESIYFWNAGAKRLEYLYVTANGGHSHGRVAPEADAISFPVATLVTAGKDFNFRSRWKRLGDDAYEVLREYETDKGWVSVRIEMKKVQ
jgi:hypothetical protein